MKKVVAYRFLIRVGSLLTVLALLAVRMVGSPIRYNPAFIGDAFLGGCFLLLLYPLKGENPRLAFAQSVVFMLVIAVGECFPRWRLLLWCVVLPLLLIAVYQGRKRILAKGVLGENRLLYAYLALILRAVAHGWPLVPLYLLLYILAYRGEPFHLESWLKGLRHRSVGGRCHRTQMTTLFEKVERLLDREKPFLDPNYREDEMAKTLFTNRVYLSQTINAVAGMNFKMLLNTYRVKYAIVLMKEQPFMNIKQVAANSGFNSSNVFIASFHLVTGEYPQQYLSKKREGEP